MNHIRATFSLVFIFSILLHRDSLCRSINGLNNSMAIFTQKEQSNVPYLNNLITEEESDLNETKTNSNNISIGTVFNKFNPNATFIQEEPSNDLHLNRSAIEESLISNETNSINMNDVLAMPLRIRRFSTSSGNTGGSVLLVIAIIGFTLYLIVKCCCKCSEKETESQENQKEIDPETPRNILLFIPLQKLAQDSTQNQSSPPVPPPPPYSAA